MALSRLSKAERTYLIDGIESGLRADGRGRNDFREFEIENDVSPQTNGSARLKCLSAGTDIMVGVKLEIDTPRPGAPNCGYLKFSVDCCAVAATHFQGRDVEYINSELTQSLERVFCHNTALDVNALGIVPGRSCWVIYVDVLVLQTGGNILDFVALATNAALRNTRVPKVTLLEGEGAETAMAEGAAAPEGEGADAADAPVESEIEISSDPYDSTELCSMRAEGASAAPRASEDLLPVSVTLSRIGSRTVVDATEEEETCMSAGLSVSVSARGEVCGVTKRGAAGLHPSVVAEMLQLACRNGVALHATLESVLTGEEALEDKHGAQADIDQAHPMD